eukprot:SAG22_NODE_3088_length_1952_cov_2.536427_2_plen_130_part_00
MQGEHQRQRTAAAVRIQRAWAVKRIFLWIQHRKAAAAGLRHFLTENTRPNMVGLLKHYRYAIIKVQREWRARAERQHAHLEVISAFWEHLRAKTIAARGHKEAELAHLEKLAKKHASVAGPGVSKADRA